MQKRRIQDDSKPFFILLFSGLMPRNEKSFLPIFSFYFFILFFWLSGTMKKVALELFHSILFWLGEFLKTILFQVLARKSLDFVVFRGPLFFHPIHYSRPASGAMKKVFFSFSIILFSAVPSEWKNKRRNRIFFHSILFSAASRRTKKKRFIIPL